MQADHRSGHSDFTGPTGKISKCSVFLYGDAGSFVGRRKNVVALDSVFDAKLLKFPNKMCRSSNTLKAVSSPATIDWHTNIDRRQDRSHWVFVFSEDPAQTISQLGKVEVPESARVVSSLIFN